MAMLPETTPWKERWRKKNRYRRTQRSVPTARKTRRSARIVLAVRIARGAIAFGMRTDVGTARATVRIVRIVMSVRERDIRDVRIVIA
jgi:hypothetical protein